MKQLWPFFTYYGGKWRSAPQYPKPRMNTIIEPFAGSAGYSLRHHTREVVIVERDPVVAALWRYLTTASGEQIARIPVLLPGQTVDDLAIIPEEKTLVGFWLNKGCASPRKSPSAWMRGGIRPNSFWGEAIRDRIAGQVEYVRHWRVIEGSYDDAPDITATWFIDPPYEGAGIHYRHSSSGIDFVRLAEWCRKRKGQVMVCENTGASWLPFAHFLSSHATEGKNATAVSHEALWQMDNPPRKNARPRTP